MYYGCDSRSGDSCQNNGQGSPDFYIGKLGQRIHIFTTSGTYFNTNAATDAKKDRTYGYWFMEGPESDPNYSAGEAISVAHDWGSQQGAKAVEAWNNADFSAWVGRSTIFGDVEASSAAPWGWLLSGQEHDYALNQAVWEGFSQYIIYYPAAVDVGVYSSHYQWFYVMGSGYQMNSAVSVWTCQRQVSSACPANLDDAVNFGGTLRIWQFHQNPDYDVAETLPGVTR